MQSIPLYQSARFGFGPRPGDEFGRDLRPALAADLDAPPSAIPAAPLASCSDGLLALQTERAIRQAVKRDGAPPDPLAANPVHDILRADRADAFDRAVATPLGFRERLIDFWANHFTVSVRQGACRALAGAFVREAIEPNLTGRFADMLLAVVRHPAMLHYLENVGSVGPDSRAGLRHGRGLNENLARECMELHTLSPASGYTQADVTSFAATLTGWSVQDDVLPYGFAFRPNAHQPGPKTILGRTFPEGEQGGIQALAFFASHPATHAHLARKLVIHFGTDRPDPREVETIAATLGRSGGDLHATSLALLDLPSAARPLAKLRSPHDWLVATWRTLGLPSSFALAAPAPHPSGPDLLAYLGQPIYEAPLPNGWPDQAADWAGPTLILRRADIAAHLATHAATTLDAAAIAQATLGPLLGPTTRAAVRSAGSGSDALALLLTSPEFQRR